MRLAEREGFEPSLPLRVNRFSRPTHSTTLPPLRIDPAAIVSRHRRTLSPRYNLHSTTSECQRPSIDFSANYSENQGNCSLHKFPLPENKPTSFNRITNTFLPSPLIKVVNLMQSVKRSAFGNRSVAKHETDRETTPDRGQSNHRGDRLGGKEFSSCDSFVYQENMAAIHWLKKPSFPFSTFGSLLQWIERFGD